MKRISCFILVLLMSLQAFPAGCTADTEGNRHVIPLASDKGINVLVIGNSFCTGWQDELRGMLLSAGVRVTFWTAAHGGSSLSQHWEWAKSGAKEYRLRSYRSPDRNVNRYPVSLEYCLSGKEWDVISIQEAYFPLTQPEYDEAELSRSTKELASAMYAYIRSYCPRATLVWHQTWALEVGWKRGQSSVQTQAAQDDMYRMIRAFGDEVAAANGAYLVPTGTAFQIARANGSGDLSRDGCHDGAENGGQYLNACVWFECVTGQSCVGNAWRPEKYTLSEERTALLQNAAHAAVEEYYGR